jgi:hypothetical protein
MNNLNFIEIGKVSFVKTYLRSQAIKMYPWAQHTLMADGGYYCFEKREDLLNFRRKLEYDINQTSEMVGLSG